MYHRYAKNSSVPRVAPRRYRKDDPPGPGRSGHALLFLLNEVLCEVGFRFFEQGIDTNNPKAARSTAVVARVAEFQHDLGVANIHEGLAVRPAAELARSPPPKRAMPRRIRLPEWADRRPVRRAVVHRLRLLHRAGRGPCSRCRVAVAIAEHPQYAERPYLGKALA